MKLTLSQQEYANKRLNDIVAAKLDKIMGPEPKRKPIQHLSNKRKYALIADGKAKLRPFSEIQYGDTWYESFVFPEEEAANKDLNKAHDDWKAKKEVETKKLRAKADKVRDRIMLSGDAAGALQCLEDFAKE